MHDIDRAILFATQAHAGQRRRFSDLPYIVHPLGTLVELYEAIQDEELREELGPAAVLHDVVEDTSVTYGQIREEFEDPTGYLVELLTLPKGTSNEEKSTYLTTLCRTGDLSAVLIKLCDRADNVRDLEAVMAKDWLWAMRYAAETRLLCDAAGGRHVPTDSVERILTDAVGRKVTKIRGLVENVVVQTA